MEYTADIFVRKGYTIYNYLEGSKYTIEIGFHTHTEGAKRQGGSSSILLMLTFQNISGKSFFAGILFPMK